MTERLQAPRFRTRLVLVFLLSALPFVAGFYLVWRDPRLPLMLALGAYAVAAWLAWNRWIRRYRCPRCGARLLRPRAKETADREPLDFYCPACDVEWVTGVRMTYDD